MTPDVPIRPASTVIVLRDAAAGPEVYLVRRHYAIAFMAGAHVFPGGRVDPADEDLDASWCDLPPAGAAARWPALSFAVAAIRELFEEAGVLLARNADGEFAAIDTRKVRARFDEHREAIHSGATTLRAVLESEGLRLALDTVVPYARWVTPPIEVRRFDTWFFITRVPPRQRPAHDAHESVDGGWLTPSAALAQARAGDIHLPPPTWATLRELERFASTESATAWASTRTIVERSPLVLERDGARQILLPGDPGHPSAERVEFETRFRLVDGRWLPEAPTA